MLNLLALPRPRFVIPGVQATVRSRFEQAWWWMEYDNKDKVLTVFEVMREAFLGLATITTSLKLKQIEEMTFHHFALILPGHDLCFAMGLPYQTSKGVRAINCRMDLRTILAAWDATYPYTTDFELAWHHLLNSSPKLVEDLQERHAQTYHLRDNFEPTM